jgi:uncharacterized membrane protein
VDTVALAATWTHAISIVILLGYYATLSLVVLPWLTSGGSSEPGRAIAALERRAFPWIIASIAAFAVSGVLLMVTSPKYEGFGNLASSSWATLIVVKHVVVIAMVALGVVLDRVLVARVDGTWWTPPAEPSREVRDLRPVAQASWAMVLLGAVVLLLTAAAQLA